MQLTKSLIPYVTKVEGLDITLYQPNDYANADGYESDFEDVSSSTSNITTSAGLSATGLKGYAKAKAEEMLTKGASSCNVDNYFVVCNSTSGWHCDIGISGVEYSGDEWYGSMIINSGGDATGTYCNFCE